MDDDTVQNRLKELLLAMKVFLQLSTYCLEKVYVLISYDTRNYWKSSSAGKKGKASTH